MARRFTRRRPNTLGRYAEPVAFARDPDARHHFNGNPNRGKYHAASLTDDFLQELQTAESRAYTPLTVSHPTQDKLGRRNPRTRTSYTV